MERISHDAFPNKERHAPSLLGNGETNHLKGNPYNAPIIGGIANKQTENTTNVIIVVGRPPLNISPNLKYPREYETSKTESNGTRKQRAHHKASIKAVAV